MSLPVYTVGHSNRTLGDFIDLLLQHDIALLADIRSLTMSRANPQFNAEPLAAALAGHGIAYRHFTTLGGLRKRSFEIPRDENALWRNRSFHNYADYALSEQFRTGLAELCTAAAQTVSAIMCAEAVWWRCHRRIVSDYLLARGIEVRHIMDSGKVVPAELTPGAVPQPDGSVVYPATETA